MRGGCMRSPQSTEQQRREEISVTKDRKRKSKRERREWWQFFVSVLRILVGVSSQPVDCWRMLGCRDAYWRQVAARRERPSKSVCEEYWREALICDKVWPNLMKLHPSTTITRESTNWWLTTRRQTGPGERGDVTVEDVYNGLLPKL